MTEREKVINDLNVAKLMLFNPQLMLTPEMYIRIGQAITSAIAMLKKQRPTGHWIVKKNKNEECYGVCSECGKEQIAGMLNYCPYCGAEMTNRRSNHDR